jgi:AraC family transcriptional regulator
MLSSHGPRTYLRQVRQRAAQRLLAETPLGLAEIASRCGIGNARQLCDRFRAVVGTTPGSWRRQAAKVGQMTPRKPSR